MAKQNTRSSIIMYTVYLIQSITSPDRKYVGYTADLSKRLSEHNSNKVNTTKNRGPWEIKVAVNFSDEDKAKAFELYLKHGSGHAFAKKHFW